MTQRFFIPGPLPGLNEILKAANKRRGKWNGYDKLRKEVENVVALSVQRAHVSPVQRVRVSFLWVEPHRRRDLDNVAASKKFILDALRYTNVLANDGWKHVEGFSDFFTVDKDKPGVWVELIEVVS